MSNLSLPPGPRGLDLVRSGLGAKGFLPGFFQHVARRYGPVASLSMGPARIVLLSSPEYAQDLLVDHAYLFEKGRGERRFTQRLLGEGVLGSEGEFHDRQHDLLMPLLRERALRAYADTVVGHGVRMQDGWSDGHVVDVFDLLAETTMAAMIEILFGTSVDRVEGRALRDALTDAVEALESLPLPVVKGADRIPLPANRRFDKARARLDSLLMPMVAERRARPTSDGDLLTSMVHARNANGDAMSDRQVRDEALTIFRGHMGTGTALSWTWYLLSRHPAAERRMLEEIDSTIGNGLPTVEDLARLQFCRMVMAESMRLFPPVWLISRRAIAEHHMGGYRIPVGSAVITSPYVIHRYPAIHPDPLRFDPDRFAPERHSGWHPFAYFPFGGGQKRCVGDDFATFETLLLLATVGRGWKLRLAPDHPVQPAPKATLKPRDGLHMVLERRASN